MKKLLCFSTILTFALILSSFFAEGVKGEVDQASPSISEETQTAGLFQRLRERRESRPRFFQGRLRGGCATG